MFFLGKNSDNTTIYSLAGGIFHPKKRVFLRSGRVEQSAIVFYIEDENAAIRLVEKNLQYNHFPARLVYFRLGRQFLDFLTRFSSSLPQDAEKDIIILLDLNLPDIHGTDILEAIRQSPDAWIRRLPVIIFTSSSDPKDRQQCKFLGCTDYLEKSFEDDRLIQALGNCVSEKISLSR